MLAVLLEAVPEPMGSAEARNGLARTRPEVHVRSVLPVGARAPAPCHVTLAPMLITTFLAAILAVLAAGFLTLVGGMFITPEWN